MNSNGLRRRDVLSSFAKGTALLPLLPSRMAEAAEPPRRIIFVCKPNGTLPELFWPQGSGSDLAAMTFPAITKALAPFAKKLTFLGGINPENAFEMWPFDGHANSGHLLSGRKGALLQDHPDAGHRVYTVGGPTLDQHLADNLPEAKSRVFPLLVLGARSSNQRTPKNSISARAANQYNAVENSPYRQFDRLFAQVTPMSSGSNVPSAMDKLRAERKSILDFVGNRTEAFVKRQGSIEDRNRVGVHLSAIRDLEKSLVVPVAPPGVVCSPVNPGQPINLDADASFPQLVRLQMDNAVLALACDLSRVVSLTLSDGDGVQTLPWMGPDYSTPPLWKNDSPTAVRTHHDVSHSQYQDATQTDLKARIEAWYSEQFAYLLGKLDAIPDGTGTLLDNTVVVFMSQMNLGHRHFISHLPIVAAGGCGGRLRTGQLLRFGDFAKPGFAPTKAFYEGSSDDDLSKRPKGVPMNGLLVSLAQAMGLSLDSYGDAKYQGTLPGYRV